MSTFFKERIYPILFMALLTAFFIAAVSAVHLATRDAVKKNENLFLRQAVLYAADIPVPEDPDDINMLYEKRVEEVPVSEDPEAEILYFRILDNSGRLDGYAVFSSGPGLWGEITAIVGYETDKKTLTGADFIKQNETPGLGARISEDWYRSQFRGKRGPFVLQPEGTADGINEIDAITGATRTSEFVQNIINNSADIIMDVTTGEENDG